jgi:uncharacterized protein YeaO (DUF488 family)
MVKLRRAQISGRVPGVDVTVKLARPEAKAFAPTWGMVMDYKNGATTMAQYTVAYQLIVDQVTREQAEWLHSKSINSTVTLLCYCRDGDFCHTYLLMDMLPKRFPDLFTR